MFNTPRVAVTVAALALFAAQAQAQAPAAATPVQGGAISVSYIEPEKFVDVPFSPVERERVLADLSQHFAKLGKLLPAGQDLKIEVTDLDMAGRIVYTRRSANELRVLNGGADWPHMDLRYTLTANGKVIDSGSAKLSNMMYQETATLFNSTQSLRYEKQMIDEWFSKQFHVKVRGVRYSG
jgi:hypothetical protein